MSYEPSYTPKFIRRTPHNSLEEAKHVPFPPLIRKYRLPSFDGIQNRTPNPRLCNCKTRWNIYSFIIKGHLLLFIKWLWVKTLSISFPSNILKLFPEDAFLLFKIERNPELELTLRHRWVPSPIANSLVQFRKIQTHDITH